MAPVSLSLYMRSACVYPSSLIVLEDVSYSALSSPSWYGLTLQNVPARVPARGLKSLR
jgi:hypothetical protein